jgi:hypothetical protein
MLRWARGATWRWSDDEGPARLRAEIEARGWSVCRFGRRERELAERPWQLAERLLGARPAMVEHQPIRPVPRGRSYASTSVPTPLHSDSQRFAGRPARLQVLLCARAARRGGASLLLDTRALLAEIADADPALHVDLHSVARTIPFVSGAVVGPTVSVRAGETWFSHSPMPVDDDVGRRLAPWLQRAATTERTLAPGELLVVDNFRVLHGRTAFVGERSLARLLVWTDPPDDAAAAARRRLAAVIDMLGGVAPGVLAARAQVDEAALYRWRERALAAALAALDEP